MNLSGKGCFTSKRLQNGDLPRHNAWWPVANALALGILPLLDHSLLHCICSFSDHNNNSTSPTLNTPPLQVSINFSTGGKEPYRCPIPLPKILWSDTSVPKNHHRETPIPTTREPVPRHWLTTKPPLMELWTNWSWDPPKLRSTLHWMSTALVEIYFQISCGKWSYNIPTHPSSLEAIQSQRLQVVLVELPCCSRKWEQSQTNQCCLFIGMWWLSWNDHRCWEPVPWHWHI